MPSFSSAYQSTSPLGCDPLEEYGYASNQKMNTQIPYDDEMLSSQSLGDMFHLEHENEHEEDQGLKSLCGFLWKFPSEGSNEVKNRLSSAEVNEDRKDENVEGESDEENDDSDDDEVGDDSYPKKCDKCQRAWVSSRTQEHEHLTSCSGASKVTTTLLSSTTNTTEAQIHKLGIPRRVWCEMNSQTNCLQWRETPGGAQQIVNCIPIGDINHVAVSSSAPNSFQIELEGRTVVFQSRDSHDPQLDVERWVEFIKMVLFFSTQQEEENAYLTLRNHSVEAQKNQNEKNNKKKTKPKKKKKKSNAIDNDAAEEVRGGNVVDIHESIMQVMQAIIADDAESLKELFAHSKASPHILDENGCSYLLAAFKEGTGPEVIQTLLDFGVDCNIQNKDGESPLLLAAASGEMQELQAILKAPNIDVNQKCANDATAFHAAASTGEVEMLRILLDSHADTTALDTNGWTALHYAAACTLGVKSVHFLCELIPDLIDYQCNEGNTALHIAARYGCIENVRALLETAANPHLQNKAGKTAYHLALQSTQIRCAVYINDYMQDSHAIYQPLPVEGSYELDAASNPMPPPPTFGSPSKTGGACSPSKHYTSYSPSKANKTSAATWTGTQYSSTTSTTSSPWIECTTEEGLTYYYNQITGDSTWYLPDPLQDKPFTRPFAITGPALWNEEGDNDDDNDGELFPLPQLSSGADNVPLCMVSMISPLVALDDPSAPTKYETRRKKQREKRRLKGPKTRTI